MTDTDQPEAPRLTDSPQQFAEAPVALQQIMALASSRGRMIEALTSDRDHWRQRAEALETALDVEIMPRYAELYMAAGLGNPSESVAAQIARQALAAPPRTDAEEGGHDG